ncbi:MAG: Rid family hydrolase [Acidimicrobiales bacterium]
MHEITVETSPLPSGSYSQGVVTNGFLFVAGIGPYDPQTRSVVGTTIEEQTAIVLENIRAVLRPAGCDLGDVVSTTVYLADLHRDWAAFDAAYGAFFTRPYPARATVGATLKNILVEIAAVATIPDQSGVS